MSDQDLTDTEIDALVSGLTEPEFTQKDIENQEFGLEVYRQLDAISKMLIEKNRKYGDSALRPAKIFSRASAIEGLKIRIDDKLKRIQTSGMTTPDEDTVMDLIGYLILLRIAMKPNEHP